MATQRLVYEDVRGVFAIMPTPATEDADSVDVEFSVDVEEAERAAKELEAGGVDAIMINGTFGEAATLTREEWETFTETVVDAVDVHVLAGPTTMDTRTTIDRAAFARDCGADGMLLGRPMWSPLSDTAIVDFYSTVADAVPELGIAIYDNPGPFKGRIKPDTWKELAEIPQVVAAKYTGAPGVTYRESMARVDEDIQLMVIERDWLTAKAWFPERAVACWSASASCGPEPATHLRDAILEGDHEEAVDLTRRITQTYQGFFPEASRELFHYYNVAIEKERMNAAGYIDAGPCRPPYHVFPDEYLEGARRGGRQWAEIAQGLRAEA